VATGQGLTLVRFSAQRKRFVSDRGCVQGCFKGCAVGDRGHQGGSQGVFCVRNGSSSAEKWTSVSPCHRAPRRPRGRRRRGRGGRARGCRARARTCRSRWTSACRCRDDGGSGWGRLGELSLRMVKEKKEKEGKRRKKLVGQQEKVRSGGGQARRPRGRGARNGGGNGGGGNEAMERIASAWRPRGGRRGGENTPRHLSERGDRRSLKRRGFFLSADAI